MIFDLAIIGAGPAGLAAAQRLAGTRYHVALIDEGKAVWERDRDASAEITRGHGGAGLFSDGKFSFFPSATELWALPRRADLRTAYEWTCNLLGSYGLDTPPFPSDPAAYTVSKGEWILKQYPSDYLSLEARLQLTEGMVRTSGAHILTELLAEKLSYNSSTDMFNLVLRDAKGNQYEMLARRLILANGRFGPPSIRTLSERHYFRRLEAGVRIEQPAHSAFFKDMTQLDPKLRFIEEDRSVEWRTFCACRDGETALTETQGLWTVSGRSDCPPTGRSNVGFNTRILDESVAARVMEPMLAALSNRDSYFSLSLDALMAGKREEVAAVDRVYGTELREIMLRGLSRLAAAFPAIRGGETRLIGPTLEGVGWYPQVDGDLRLLHSPAWVAGDACGLFRGIVAALISGYYVADSALQELAVLR